MSRFLTASGRRWLPRLGGLLLLGGAGLYGLEQQSNTLYQHLQQAEVLYDSQQYQEAITAYERVLGYATTPALRLRAVLLGRVVNPAAVALHIANCHYRLAETELRTYQKAVKDPRVTPRPALETVQRLLNAAGKAYEEVPQTDPRTGLAAQTNAVRVAAWQLILAAFDNPTPGRRTIRQQALQAMQRAAAAVDYAHDHQQHISRQEHMTAMLLLETLTTFGQERPSPSLPLLAGEALRSPLGDLLLRDTPELSAQERERFRQFFFALPLEAKDPWPTGGGGAGGAQGRFAH